jgi:hypothetical protein
MSDPVILIGTSQGDGRLIVVGLYATVEEASHAVQHGDLPSAHYSVMTPKMGSYVQARDD